MKLVDSTTLHLFMSGDQAGEVAISTGATGSAPPITSCVLVAVNRCSAIANDPNRPVAELFVTVCYSASTAIEGMRLLRQLNDALLPLDASRQESWGDEFERLLIANRYSHFRP